MSLLQACQRFEFALSELSFVQASHALGSPRLGYGNKEAQGVLRSDQLLGSCQRFALSCLRRKVARVIARAECSGFSVTQWYATDSRRIYQACDKAIQHAFGQSRASARQWTAVRIYLQSARCVLRYMSR